MSDAATQLTIQRCNSKGQPRSIEAKQVKLSYVTRWQVPCRQPLQEELSTANNDTALNRPVLWPTVHRRSGHFRKPLTVLVRTGSGAGNQMVHFQQFRKVRCGLQNAEHKVRHLSKTEEAAQAVCHPQRLEEAERSSCCVGRESMLGPCYMAGRA